MSFLSTLPWRRIVQIFSRSSRPSSCEPARQRRKGLFVLQARKRGTSSLHSISSSSYVNSPQLKPKVQLQFQLHFLSIPHFKQRKNLEKERREIVPWLWWYKRGNEWACECVTFSHRVFASPIFRLTAGNQGSVYVEERGNNCNYWMDKMVWLWMSEYIQAR